MSAVVSPEEQTLQGVRWVVLERWTSRAWTLAVFTVVARLLGAEDFGAVAFAAAITALLSMLLEQGLTAAVVQRRDLTAEQASTAHTFLVGGAVTVAVIGCCAAEWVEKASRIPGLTPLLQLCFATMVVATFQVVPLALMQRRFAFRASAIRKMISTLIGGATGLVAAVSGLGAASMVLQSLAFAICGALLLLPGGHLLIPLRWSWPVMRALWRGSVVIGLSGLLSWASDGLDRLVLGALLGAVALGVYTVAARLLTVVDELVSSTVFGLALPLFSRLHGTHTFWATYVRGWTFSAALVVPAFAGLAVVGPGVVPLAFGAQWQQAGQVAQVLALAIAVRPGAPVDRAVLFATDRASAEVWLTSVGAMLNATGLVVGALVAGLEGAAWGLAVVSAGVAGTRTWVVTRPAPRLRLELLSQLARICLASAGSAAAAAAVLGGVTEPGAIRLGLAVIAGVTAYAIALRVVAPEFSREAYRLGRKSMARSA